jgi:cytochrome c oxidase assembly factor CtaG
VDVSWLFVVALICAAGWYEWSVAALRRRGDHWVLSRLVAARVAIAALGATLVPPLSEAMSFSDHAVQHVLLAMLAPL